ncbi:FG-GAP-like repeat-containing protein [Sanyastnella coralliicola]|uniref:FG-GAP-like repeat-containing protein n=1 Tax=Sanyastnella coralliicola TaxID=3069118 RepID=UPI0027B8CBC1|nr:FG-GAP-like repeat-containing protein [Longitalea sp. SCSIO 12813]
MTRTVSILTILFLPALLCAQTFVNVAPENNFVHQFYGTEYGTGISFYDVNGDGWDDITVGQANETISLYLNIEGELSPPISIGAINANPKGINWCDYDNDGDPDLLVTNYNSTNHLYRNDGNFNNMLDVTAEVGILHDTSYLSYGISWGDTDRDGDLDLYICNYNADGITNEFYVNNGDGTFTESAAMLGVDDGSLWSFQGLFTDYDHDLWPDLHVINDRLPATNNFYKNENGSFSNITTEIGLEMYIFSMNNSMADYDRDGDMDLYVSNNPFGNYLMRQEEDGTFSHVSEETGTSVFDHSWSALWIDYDNDGWEDLHVNCSPFWGEPGQNRFFVNLENGTFFENAAGVGLGSDNGATNSSAMGDLNNDGFPDFVVQAGAPDYSRIYRNTGNTNAFLTVDLVGTVSNTEGIGAWIEVFSEGTSQLRYTQSGEGFLTHNSGKEFIGLGQAEVIDSMIVEWPSGHVDTFYDVEINQQLNIAEGSSMMASILNEGTSICEGDSLLLIASNGMNPVWNNGTENDSLWVQEPGVYSYITYSELGIPYSSTEFTVQSTNDASYTVTNVDPACLGSADGEISIELNENAIATVNGENYDEPLMNLPAGQYELIVSEEGLCTVTTIVELVSPPAIELELSIENPLCAGDYGMASAEASGGTGVISINWNDVNPDELEPDTYEVNVIDENGCSISETFEIESPDEIVIDVVTVESTEGDNGSIQLDISGGEGPYTINWNGPDGFSDTGELIENLSPGIYTASIVDSNGCMELEIIDLDSMNVENLLISDFLISPNPSNDVIYISNLPVGAFQCSIYGIDGRLVQQIMIPSGTEQLEVSFTFAASGMFVVQIESNQGLARKQIIKR